MRELRDEAWVRAQLLEKRMVTHSELGGYLHAGSEGGIYFRPHGDGGVRSWTPGVGDLGRSDWRVYRERLDDVCEVAEALRTGRKVRRGNWEAARYRHMVSGRILDEQGEPAPFEGEDLTATNWEVFEP